jgi:hypothetical protein
VDQIDRELASILSVDPSPEFRARVRERIESEPAPKPWYRQWRLVGAGVAAVSVLIAIAVEGVNRRQHDSPAWIGMVIPAPEVPAAVDASTPVPRIPAPPVHRTRRRTEFEVLVAPSEARGLRQLAAIVDDGRTRFVLFDEQAANVEREPAREIVIAPIAIAPIEVAAESFSVNSVGDEQ